MTVIACSSDEGSLAPRMRSVKLTTSLIARIVLVAIACFGLVTGMVFFETWQETRQQDVKLARLVAQHLELQRLRIDADYDMASRFPDWDAVVNNLLTSGRCLRFEDEAGRILRSHCIGVPASQGEAPRWFSVLHGVLLPSGPPATETVSFKDKVYGTVRVTSDAKADVARSWRTMKQMLSLTAITILSLCLLVYLAIERALAPTKEVVAGLNRLAEGDIAHRLPDFRLSELQRIGEVANQLAEKIEITLSERARLSKRLVNAQEQERHHLARELHDEFAQNLTAIGALAASLEKSAERDCADLCVEARTLSQISATMMKSLRGTLFHLRPADLDEFGLIESLRQLIAVWRASGRHGTRFELDVPQAIDPLPAEAAIHVFRIAQEGLTNAVKHSDAKTVRLSLAAISMEPSWALGGRGIQLVIEDDGAGRRDGRGDGKGKGMGILNMRERVAALGGSIAFEDRSEAGLTVRVTIPTGMAGESAL